MYFNALLKFQNTLTVKFFHFFEQIKAYKPFRTKLFYIKKKKLLNQFHVVLFRIENRRKQINSFELQILCKTHFSIFIIIPYDLKNFNESKSKRVLAVYFDNKMRNSKRKNWLFIFLKANTNFGYNSVVFSANNDWQMTEKRLFSPRCRHRE